MNPNILKPSLSFLLILLCTLGVSCKKKDKIIVACVGDSITFGARLEDRASDAYPAHLQRLLGDAYKVLNLGVGGCTLIRKGKPTVWNELNKIKNAKPDIVVISLGTNDTCGMGTCGQRKCWEYKGEYKIDYLDLIDTLYALPSKPRIWISAPSPMVMETPGLDSSRIAGLTIRKPRLDELITLVKQVATEKQTGFIDLNTPLDHKPELFTQKDGVHPNKAGYQAIAELIYEALMK